MRVVQAADGTGFTLEAFPALRVVGKMFGQDFDGNRAIQPGIGSFVDFTHATGTNEGRDFVGAETCTSVVTSKPANDGHFKTGQRGWPGTVLFYLFGTGLGKPVLVLQLRGPHLRMWP